MGRNLGKMGSVCLGEGVLGALLYPQPHPSTPGYFMDHAVRLEDLPIRYQVPSSPPFPTGENPGTPLPPTRGGPRHPGGVLTPLPWPGSSAPAPATGPRPTQAGSRGGSTVSTSSPRYWWNWGKDRGVQASWGARRGGDALPRPLSLQVEMFGVTAAESGDESEALLAEFLGLQKEIFSELGLHYR